MVYPFTFLPLLPFLPLLKIGTTLNVELRMQRGLAKALKIFYFCFFIFKVPSQAAYAK